MTDLDLSMCQDADRKDIVDAKNIIKELHDGHSVSLACKRAGVRDVRYYELRKAYPTFAEYVSQFYQQPRRRKFE